MVLHHPPPLLAVEVLEVQPLAVRAVGHDDRIAALRNGAENVAAEHEPVVDLDRHVPVDAHAVADFAHLAITHSRSPMEKCRGGTDEFSGEPGRVESRVRTEP